MAIGRSNQLTKQIGEYLVACELARRGFLVATFSGNVPDFDLIATDFKGASCPIQVKTSNVPSWQLNIDKFVEITFEGNKQIIGSLKPLPVPDLICVFVIAGKKYGEDQFFILEMSKAQEIIVTHHKNFLDAHGGIRPRRPESLHSSILQSELQPYKDNWSIITDRL